MNYKFKDEKGEHLHELDGTPLMGTSTVLSVLAKTLTYWAAGLAVAKFGWTNPKEVADKELRMALATDVRDGIKLMNAEEYLALLDEAYKAHATKLKTSATAGTDMHAELESYVKFCMEKNGGKPMGSLLKTIDNGEEMLKDAPADRFAIWAEENVKKFLISEGHVFSKTFRLGGIVDCVFEDKQGRICIMDFKSAKEVYMSHWLQCGGYDIQIAENGFFDKDGNQILKLERSVDYYAVFPFGAKTPEPQFNYNLVGLREGFLAALTLYKLQNEQK